MITYRTLVKTEYPALKEVADGFTPPPESSIAILARDGEKTIGRVLLVAPAHVEGIWVEEGYRGGNISDNLMKKAEIEARACYVKRLYAYAVSPAIERRLERLGYKKQEFTVWSKDLIPCQQQP